MSSIETGRATTGARSKRDESGGQRIEASGLEDVVAASTRLSDVDGEGGRLVLAGHPVEELAGVVPFEDVMFLLFRGRLPDAAEHRATQDMLGSGREAAFARLSGIGDALSLSDPMDALRAGVAHLSVVPSEDPLAEAARIVSTIAVLAAAWAGARPLPAGVSGQSPASLVRPDPRLGHAADYLRMATAREAPPASSRATGQRGGEPSAAAVAALNAYFVTVIDHGMNASTFAARVVASTASDTVSAVVAAIGALKGKLHGGAPGPVLDMLDAAGAPEKAGEWVESALARGERIMGMGHRVYRVRDPRALVLERAIGRLEAAAPAASSIGQRLRMARAVEREAESQLAARYPDRPLKANVEFYTAVVLEAVGLPRALFTPTFAASRAAGWCAHVEEQRRHGRLIRPKSRFVDVPPGP